MNQIPDINATSPQMYMVDIDCHFFPTLQKSLISWYSTSLVRNIFPQNKIKSEVDVFDIKKFTNVVVLTASTMEDMLA